MIFERHWALALLLIPLLWMAWEWRRQARRTPLILKTAMILAVILALTEPVLETRDRKVALAALVDTSASITPEDLNRESDLIAKIQSQRGSNRLDVIPFARAPRALTPAESGLRLQHTPGAAGRGTNIESPVREALASLPAGMIHRVAAHLRRQRE